MKKYSIKEFEFLTIITSLLISTFEKIHLALHAERFKIKNQAEV